MFRFGQLSAFAGHDLSLVGVIVDPSHGTPVLLGSRTVLNDPPDISGTVFPDRKACSTLEAIPQFGNTSAARKRTRWVENTGRHDRLREDLHS
jgi:hypothetical protein